MSASQANAYLTQFAKQANAEHKLDIDLHTDIGMKHWSMDQGKRIRYQKDDSHTLSIYLKGGEKNYRTDVTGLKGAPGKICLMPQGQTSQWQIKGKVEFVHLYFSDSTLKRYAATNFGIDVRFIELIELLFQDDYQLQSLFHENLLLRNHPEFYSPLYAEQAIHKVMHHLLKNYNGYRLSEKPIKGGLSPYHMKFIREMIHDGLAEKLTIEKLAALVDLSPFHFARMFKLSFGESPASFITRARVDSIKHLLQQNKSLAEISLLTGFNQQSHMTQHFKRLTGMTPAIYRQKIQ